MRNSVVAAMLIAFGTTVAMPAMAAVYAFQPPETQHQQMQHQQMQKNAGKGRAEAAPSELSGQHQPMRKDARKKGVTTGSTAGLMIRTPSATSRTCAESGVGHRQIKALAEKLALHFLKRCSQALIWSAGRFCSAMRIRFGRTIPRRSRRAA